MDDTTQSKTTYSFSRRRAITAGTGLFATGLAGCIGGFSSNKDASVEGPVAVASFFSFYDFARKVANGTPVEVRNLIPTGLHGHGWEPDASITRDIIEADAFIHVGSDFQPWADRAIQTLKDDNVDTQLINVREGIGLVDLAASLDPDEEGVGEGRGKDPHFWLDPDRAKQSVDNITDGLVELAPDHESTFRENASTYKTDVLEQIDQDYQAIFDAAERDVVQLAAHNAFQYIGVKYDIQMRPLVVNLAASGNVKPSDITEAKRVIDENDIKYIGAAVFETRRPAQQLVAETAVEAYYPVTPYAGVREDWVENNWGYEEIAYNINMPTFEVVLGNKQPEEVGPDGWADEWMSFE
ncbi:ABC-type metal ion transport system, periplasmic component/surface adhesin [Halovivax ruber XH-70]|uniref:ABC-type metal ion transport system, periplasmic component/surface adhesin n=1 Tax=Halovivax ruber (strain DSM 18193 / JCM 13892 / XH-70) TaxID=797302 RepID=L0IAK5_HALRX|nr:metal ABC transporter substrate-binding protein [Halovivax ruber]AGB14982.1 ABC-type metal ion transport system, periplasmic component/surface adhesin [Halovivax ruber XH-70]